MISDVSIFPLVLSSILGGPFIALVIVSIAISTEDRLRGHRSDRIRTTARSLADIATFYSRDDQQPIILTTTMRAGRRKTAKKISFAVTVDPNDNPETIKENIIKLIPLSYTFFDSAEIGFAKSLETINLDSDFNKS